MKSFIGENRLDGAIRQANTVWVFIKKNGKEDEIKLKCGNIMAEAFQKTDQWDDILFLQAENLKCHVNDMKTLLLTLREALHCRNWK
jgi:hypothetical protein